MIIQTNFDRGDHVTIDGCKEIKAVVLAICIRGNNVTYEVAWMLNGSSYSAWVEDFRLSDWVY